MRSNFVATRRHMFSANLLQDPLFECWNDDDTTLPGTYLIGSGSPTFIRETAAADVAVGKMSVRMTFAVSASSFLQNILDTSSYDDYLDGRVVTAGCFVKSSTSGIARIKITDGATTTSSAFHTGGGAFEFLDVEHTIDAAATALQFSAHVEAAGNAIFSGAVFLISAIKPDQFVLTPMIRSTLVHSRPGELFTGPVDSFSPQRAFIVEHVQVRLGTSPVGADMISDVEQWDGSAWTSMFTSGGRPTIAPGAVNAGAVPDGTYNRRCFVGMFGSTVPVGGLIRSNIDQVGSTTAGDDLLFFIRYKAWPRPQELIAAFDMDN